MFGGSSTIEIYFCSRDQGGCSSSWVHPSRGARALFLFCPCHPQASLSKHPAGRKGGSKWRRHTRPQGLDVVTSRPLTRLWQELAVSPLSSRGLRGVDLVCAGATSPRG